MSQYKYHPNSFLGMLGIPEDLMNFYGLLEKYEKSKTRINWWDLREQWETLFFTIKHRE